jgi:hypothetical protein
VLKEEDDRELELNIIAMAEQQQPPKTLRGRTLQ